MTKSPTLFRTLVDVFPFPKLVQVAHSHVFLGSCFAQNIGGKFQEYGLDATVNPLGTLYNPQSIALVVRHALRQDAEAIPVLAEDGVYRCWLAGMQVGEPTEEACRQRVRALLEGLADALRRAGYVFVTLGTNVCYRHCGLDMVVANCHHAPRSIFAEERMTAEQCVACLLQTVEMLREAAPEVQVVFTVSPFRYAKYGFHGSQLSKATLLLAVDEVCRRRTDCCQYFPSYEIVMDELRDYRFYEADMIHPSGQAVDYIWQRLVDGCFSASAQQYLREYEPVRRGLLHRPVHLEGEVHARFLQELERRKNELRAKYVGIHI